MSLATATTANVAGSNTSVVLFAAEAGSGSGADGRVIYNDSTAVLYVKFGVTASNSSYTVQIAAGGYFEFPQPVFQGEVDGIWASATGNARLSSW